MLALVSGQRHRWWLAISSPLHWAVTLCTGGVVYPSRWVPPLGFVPMSPPSGGRDWNSSKNSSSGYLCPSSPRYWGCSPSVIHMDPPQERTWGFPWGLGMQGRDRRGQGSWDGAVGKRVGSALSCAANAGCSLAFGEGESWGRTAAVEMRCCLGHISSHQNGSQGAVCLEVWFLGVLFPPRKTKPEHPSPCCAMRPSPVGEPGLPPIRGASSYA